MATVRGSGPINRQGYHTSKDIDKTNAGKRPRDEMIEAFAGDENEGPFRNRKENHRHSTNVKSRKTEESKHRVPKR